MSLLAYYDSVRCALNRDTVFPGSCAGVSCCLGVPDDSRTKGSTAAGRDSGRGNCGFWKDGESMIVVMCVCATPPPPGGGAKDGESTMMDGTGSWDTGGGGTGGKAVAERAVPCSTISVLPSRRPSSSAMVGGGTARSSLNFGLFWTTETADFDCVADVGGGALVTGAVR